MTDIKSLNKMEPTQRSLSVLKKFRLIYGTMKQHFREIERNCGISGSQLWLLQEIRKSPNIGVSQLAELLSIHQSTCSQLVEKLVVRKFVVKVRSQEDQRRVGLRITDDAELLLAKAPAPAEGVLPEALKALPNDVLLMLDSSLENVIKQLHDRDDTLADNPLSDL